MLVEWEEWLVVLAEQGGGLVELVEWGEGLLVLAVKRALLSLAEARMGLAADLP